MSKQRSPGADYAVYLLVRIVVCVIQALPPNAAGVLAGGLAWLAYHVDRRHRAVARDNLKHAFPVLTDPRKLDDLVRGVFRHFCALLVDIMHTPRRLNPYNWRSHIELDPVNGGNAVAALLSDRPVLFVTAHFGNWEMGGYVMGMLGFTTYAIARRLDNPHLDWFLKKFRERTGQVILDKNDDYDKILAVLAGGGALATLGDQDAGERGLFVDFFGRRASTHKAVALLALQYRVPMVVTGVVRTGESLRYGMHFVDLILPEEYDGRTDAVRAITQRFTLALEDLIRKKPNQYFWLHRRWKHQPPVRGKQATMRSVA